MAASLIACTKRRCSALLRGTEYEPFIVALLCLLILQVVPLPASLIECLSPRGFLAVELAKPLVEPVSGCALTGWRSIAPYRYPVLLAAVRIIVNWLLFLGLRNTFVKPCQKRRALILIWCVAVAEALYGIFQYATGSTSILWYPLPAYLTRARGTYICPNHFAFLLCIGLLLTGIIMLDRPPHEHRRHRFLRRVIIPLGGMAMSSLSFG